MLNISNRWAHRLRNYYVTPDRHNLDCIEDTRRYVTVCSLQFFRDEKQG